MSSPDSPASPEGLQQAVGGVHAPFHGMVTVLVELGDVVASGQVVAVLEAMKMEAPITAPRPGTVSQVVVSESATVLGGDLLLVIT